MDSPIILGIDLIKGINQSLKFPIIPPPPGMIPRTQDVPSNVENRD